ncbi:unnamed protein product [Calypogeia fissa]
MEEQDDEVGMVESRSTSSWSAAEGTLEQSVKVVEESEDAIYTAGPTSRLVLVPPPASSSSSSSEREPCELTVTFQQSLGHVHQIFVISTARICEIYGQKEQDGDREYVCTVRGGVISLSDDEGSAYDSSEGLPDRAEEEDFDGANFNSNTNPAVPSAIPELESAKEVRPQNSPSEGQSAEVATIEKIVSSQPDDDYPSHSREDSKEDLFRSFTEAINGRDVEESTVFEESLGHANWVECPHSPLKSNISASDDETEVDASTNGFYLIDTDVESQQSDQPQVRLFTDAIRASGKISISNSLERGNTGSSGHSSWQEAIEDSTREKDLTDVTSPDRSKSERNSGEGHEVEESFETPWAQVEDFAGEFNGENLPGSGYCVFEVNQDCDSSSSAISRSTPGKALGTEVVQASALDSAIQENEDMESRFPVEAPVYECEVSLVDADAWTSVTIRLLSIKSKSQVQIHRVVVTYTPGPPIQPPASISRGSFQQGAGTSSLLAILVPGILQMARGMSETRLAKNSAVSSAGKEIRESAGSPSKVMNGKSSSLPPNVLTVQDIAPDQGKMKTNDIPHMVDKSFDCEVEDKISSRSDVAEINSHGTASLESIAEGETQIGKGEGSMSSEEIQTVHKETGHLEAHQKEDRVDELVQRLDRLETICLRMESSLNAAIEKMDKRLKLLESGGPGRMPPALGHPIWGPGFDSASFVSATSVYVPAAHTGPGTPSLMDSQIPFSMGSAGDVPVGENSTKRVSSTGTPVYPSLVSSTSPPSLPATLPAWPLSSWPQNVSLDSSSHSSGLTASFISKSGLMNRSNGSLNDSDHQSNGEETFWESRTSDESESEISSDSEQTSYADNCEDEACGCCPESLPSSPTNPAQLVDNALASALSAFSASFGAQNKSSPKEFYHSEGSDEEGSFTTEEQVPLVELDAFPSYYEKEEDVHDEGNVFLHGYEAIPLSSDKDIGDLSSSKVILEDNFWSSEIEKSQELSWQEDGLQTQEEKIFRALEDCVNQTEGGTTTFESFSAVLIQVSDQPSLTECTTGDTFSADLQSVLQKDVAKDTKEAGDVGADLEDQIQDLHQNPFLQELIAGEDRKVRGAQLAWHQSWTGDQAEIAKNVLSSCFTVGDFSNPLASTEEMLLQEGLFPDEWNWFTSESSPFSSLVEVRDLSEDAPIEKEPVLVQIETVTMPDGVSLKASPSRLEPWSLLDDDVTMPSTPEQYSRDSFEQDWAGQKSQWSLLDEYPPDATGEDKHPEAGSPVNSHGNSEPRSLLDEDIPLPSSKVLDVDQDALLFSSRDSLFDDLTDVFQSSTLVDVARSPSSEASKSNPFEDEHREGTDFSQGSHGSHDVPLVLLEEFEGEVHQFEAPGSEGTQTLMFHMSL